MILEREGLVRTVPRRGMFVAEGARSRAAVAADQRIEEAVDRLMEEATRMGIDSETFLDAMTRRLRGGEQDRSTDEGSRS
jgi:DNA-binding transcriptional regulator YhcF (GntR family)